MILLSPVQLELFLFFYHLKFYLFIYLKNIYILLKYSWLTMFQVHSKVIQLYKYTYIIFEIIFLHRLLEDIDYDCFYLGHHIAGSRGKLTGFTSLDQSVAFFFIDPPSSLRKMDHLTSKTPGFFNIFLTSLLISMLWRFLIISQLRTTPPFVYLIDLSNLIWLKWSSSCYC